MKTASASLVRNGVVLTLCFALFCCPMTGCGKKTDATKENATKNNNSTDNNSNNTNNSDSNANNTTNSNTPTTNTPGGNSSSDGNNTEAADPQLTALVPAKVLAPGEGIDSGYIPAKASLVAVVNPKRILDSDFIKQMNADQELGELLKEVPVDPNKLESLTLFLNFPDDLSFMKPRRYESKTEGIKYKDTVEDAVKEGGTTSTPDDLDIPKGEFKEDGGKGDKEESRLDVDGDTQFVLYQPEEDTSSLRPQPEGLVLRFNQPVKKEILQEMTHGKYYDEVKEEEVEFEGKKYTRISSYFEAFDFKKSDKFEEKFDEKSEDKSEDKEGAEAEQKEDEKVELELIRRDALYMPDEKTIVLCSERNLKEILKGSGSSSPLYDRLAKTSKNHDASFVFTFDGREDLRAVIEEGMKSDGLDQTPFGKYLEVITLANAASGSLDVSNGKKGDSLVHLIIEGKDDASATKILTHAKGLLGFAFLGYGTLSVQLKKDPEGQKVEPLVSALVKSLKAEQVGKHVVLNANLPEDATTIAPILGEAIKNAAKTAQLARQRNNLKQIGLAFHNYHDVYTSFFHDPKSNNPKFYDENGALKLSWRVHLTPYVDAFQLYDQAKFEEGWNSEANKKLIPLMPATYKTPGISEAGKTGWRIFSGPSAPYQPGKKIAIQHFTDGTSNTILAVQVGPDKAVTWTDPTPLKFDPKDPKANKAQLGKIPDEGFLVLFCDGYVTRIRKDIDPVKLTELLTIDGGEVVDVDAVLAQ